MRRQWPCSKCGFACSSTWRSLYPSKPVVCSTCMSRQQNIIVALNNPPQMQIEMDNIDQEARFIPSKMSSFDDHDQISSSHTSIMQRNMSLTVSQIGTIFGKLPFEPLSIPVNVLDCGNESSSQLEPELKSKAVEDQKHCEFGFQNHFYCGPTSLRSSTGPGLDCDCQQTLLGARSFSVWDPNKVQRRRRSKLHQYTLSPLARLLKQLHHVYRSNINKISTLNRAACNHRGPKYDDALIYEKCKYVCENEIGLGAKLLFQPTIHFSKKEEFYKPGYTCGYLSTSSSASENGAYSNCLIDVPIRSSL